MKSINIDISVSPDPTSKRIAGYPSTPGLSHSSESTPSSSLSSTDRISALSLPPRRYKIHSLPPKPTKASYQFTSQFIQSQAPHSYFRTTSQGKRRKEDVREKETSGALASDMSQVWRRPLLQRQNTHTQQLAMTSPGKQSQKRPPSPTPAARIRPRWNKWVKALSDLFPTSHTTTSSVVKPSTTSAVSNTSLCSSRSWEVASPNLSLPQSTERPVLAAAGDKISQQSEISGVKMFRETESRPLSQGQQNYQEQHSPKKYRVPPGTDATTTTPTAVSAAVVAAYTNKQTGNEQQQHQHQHQQHQQHQQLSSLPQLPREIFHQTPVMSAEDPQIPGHVAAVHQQLKGAEDDSNDNSSSINTTITTVITTASIGADYTPVAATETCSERPNMRQEQKVEGEGGTNQPFALTTRIATRRWLSRSLERIKSFRQLWARVRARQNRFGGSVITVFCMTAVVILVLC